MSAFCPVNWGQCLCSEVLTVGCVEARVSQVLSPLCTQLERSYQRFTAFYASRHSGRKLTWLYQLSKGELVTNCFKNRYTLQVRSLFILEVGLVGLFNIKEVKMNYRNPTVTCNRI